MYGYLFTDGVLHLRLLTGTPGLISCLLLHSITAVLWVACGCVIGSATLPWLHSLEVLPHTLWAPRAPPPLTLEKDIFTSVQIYTHMPRAQVHTFQYGGMLHHVCNVGMYVCMYVRMYVYIHICIYSII